MDQNYIIIGTTSINRPELHNEVLPEWVDWLSKINQNAKKYKIIWFINIDIIPNLEDSYESTVENYKKIVAGKEITQFFYKNPDGKGNFLYACKRISENIVNYVNDNKISSELIKIFWLEDDWKLNKRIAININTLIENFSGNMTHINLTFIRNNYIWALAPSILSYNLWKSLHYSAWLAQTETTDPEHCLGLYFIKNFGKPLELHNLTVINKEVSEEYYDNSNFINYEKSFYTYFDKDTFKNKLVFKDNYIEKNLFLEKYKDTIFFVRITPGFCVDYGREFLQKKKIEKLKTNGNDFYQIN